MKRCCADCTVQHGLVSILPLILLHKRSYGKADLVGIVVDADYFGIDCLSDLKDLGGRADLVVGYLSTPGTISAKAPNGIRLTIFTSATSPTPYLSVKIFHGLVSSVLYPREILFVSGLKSLT